MRLWSLHPEHLDARGLVALWREALLAKAVLRRRTKGYRYHPQLDRFRAAPKPIAAINAYLRGIELEARARGYRFDMRKLAGPYQRTHLIVTRGQVAYEWRHLLGKLRRRSAAAYARAQRVRRPRVHPLFQVRAGGRAAWERPPTQRAR